jgi:hypothetical protein
MKDLEGSSSSLLLRYYPDMSRGTEENPQKSLSGLLVTKTRFKLRAYQIHSRSVNHSTTSLVKEYSEMVIG